MSERLQNSPDLGKLKSKRSKELLERYAQQREQYYRTKNKGDRVTEEQRRIIDAEMDKKINDLYEQENEKKKGKLKEISSIASGLDKLNTSDVKNLNIPNFEFNDAIGFGSIQAIREQAQLYSNFNGEIHKKAENISTLYNQFMQIVNLFNKEREEDTRWSGDTDYENYVDAINGKIEEFKKLFADAEAELTKAVNKSDRAGQRLNEAPDNLRNTEGTNQEGTEGQFNEQNQIHNEQLQAYTQQGQRLQQGSQNLQQNQIFLNNYNDQLVQVTDALTVQKNQVDTTLLDWDNKKRNFKNIMNGLCSESNVSPFSDDELRQLISDPENFIKKIEPQERQQAALNLINAHGQELAEYVQIIDRYQTGVDQSMQISQGITEVQNRQTMVAQSQQDIENQQGIVSDEIIANNARMQNLQQLMIESQNQHEQSIEYYHQNMDDIDYLDFEMSSIILDNDISNGGILESIANQRKSFNGLKVEAKGGWERAWDSTVGMVCKGVNWTLDLVKDCVLFLPNLIQELGEKNPSIGESWLFKTLTLPLQIQAGISEGIIELTEGLFTMVEQPMATLNGLGQLIGRDAQTGEWSFGAAGDAWLNFCKALIAYDDWGEGNDGRALGKGIANIGTIFIPMAGEFSAAANTAKVARVVGGVSKTRAALIGTTDFFTRTGSKVTRFTKGIGNNIRHPVKTIKRGFGYVEDVAEGAVKRGKAIASDVSEAGGVTKYVKRGLETTSNAYHNAGGVRGLGRQYLELGTGWTYVKGVKKLIKGEPLFGKKFPSLKKLPKERLKMEERLQKLRGQNGVGGEIESMYQKVSKYVDKNGDLLEGVKGSEIPVREWGKIADYQSALQEIRSLEATISRYKQVETSLIDESGNYTKLGEFIQKNKNFGKTMEEMLADPSKAKEIFAEFKKKNPKVDISALEDIEIFRDGGKVYRIKNGELIEGEENVVKAKRTYTYKDYKMTQEGFDELVAEGYTPGTAEFNEALRSSGLIGEPIELEGITEGIVKAKRTYTYKDYKMTQEGFDELVAEGYTPGTAEFNEALRSSGLIGEPIELEAGAGRIAEGTETGRIAEGTETGRIAEGTETGRVVEGTETGRVAEGTEAGRVAEGTEIPQRTIQDIFDDLSLEKITPKEARRELAKALHPDLLGDDASILLRDALEDYNKIVSGKHPEFERSHDWSKISGEYAGKPRVAEGTAIPKRPKLDPARNDRFSKETLDLFDDGDIIELSYKGGKGPISERRVKENGGYRKLKENGGKYESTETVVTEEEMVTKMRDAITIDPIKWSPKGATEGTRVVPERPSPTVIELEYKGGKKTISERRIKEEGGYRKFEGESGKYERTETVLTENEMAIRIKEVKSEGGTGIEVGKGTDIFEWAESKATEAGNRLTEVKKKPVEPISNKKSEILPSNLQEGDMLTRNGYDMKITKRIQNEGKVSYEFEYTEGGTTQKISMTAEELAGGWSDVTDIIRQQDIHIKGMNEYFTKNVASCRDKKIYIEGNEYTATKATDGTLHLTYSGGHNYPIRYEIKDGKLQMVRNKALQNDITVSSFNELKTKWNASPIDDGRTISGTLRENITELTADEAANVKFWNKLWKEEKDQAIKNIKRRPTEATEAKPVETAVEVTSETEIPVVRNFSPEGGYKSPIDTFDELLNSPEGVTIEGVNYRWDFTEFTNPPKHIHNKGWRPNIKLVVKNKNGVIHTFETKYKPGENIKPGELVQPTKVLPGPKVEWEMSADGKWYPKKVEELPSNAEDLIKTYYEARQKYVDHYNRSLPVRQGEGGAVVPAERTGGAVVPAERTGGAVVPAERTGGAVVPVERTTIPPTSPEMKPPLIPDVPKWVSVAAIAILANKDKDETINIDVPGTTGFEWTPQDQKEVSELQELLSKNPTRQEVKDLIRGDKDAFKKLILVKDGVNGGANINFDILNYLVEQGKFNGLNGDIQEQLKHDVIKYIGLGDILEEGTTFTVTSTDGTKRNGKIVNNRAVDERGRYIPIFQGDHIESDALGFLDPIYPYNNTNSEGGTDPDTELENALEQI